MFTHRIQIQLRPDSFTLLSRKIENTIYADSLPSKGFQNGLTTIAPERSTATEDTYWNTKENAEAYQQTGYLEVMKALSELVSAPPISSIFESSSSTIEQS